MVDKIGTKKTPTDYYFWLGESGDDFHNKTMEKINARKGVDNPDEKYRDTLNEAISKWGKC